LWAVAPGGHRLALFEEVGADACVQNESARLEPLLEPVRQVATSHRHPTGGGTLTGWHPRTFDGLRKSVLAIGL
jgi:hypothetical protein